VGAALAARPERPAPLVQTDREGAKSLERLGRGLGGRAEILERFANGDALARVVLLLRFLTPLSAPCPITQRYGR